MSRSIYSTNIKQCVLPHYKKGGGDYDELFKSWTINQIFEGEQALYNDFGKKMSSAVSGICLADLFTQFGLAQRDEYIKKLFSTISCYKGDDTVVSFLVASRPYRMITTNDPTSTCPDNVVFKKGCLILPRGEILWSLLAIPGDKIGIDNDPNSFKIYVQSVKEVDGKLPLVTTSENEHKSHAEHIKVGKISKLDAPAEDATKKKDQYYVTLNPIIYTRIRAYKCIESEGRTLNEQYFMMHNMNLLYAQTFGALSLLSVLPQRLLQYPPATRESICIAKGVLNVGVPESQFKTITEGAILEAKDNHGNNVEYFEYPNGINTNIIAFPESKNSDVCVTNRDNFHNFCQQYEKVFMSKVRDEQQDIKPSEDFDKMPFVDDLQRTFYYKLIKNTYPSVVKLKDDEISKFTPNVVLTALGVVSLRDICEGDPLIFKDNVMDISSINDVSSKTGWECSIERLEIPKYQRLPEAEKAGEASTPAPKIQANPHAYSSAFVTSIGTNITILPPE